MNCPSHFPRFESPREISRRWFLKHCGVGLGGIALGGLLARDGFGAGTPDPLALRRPHFAPKAKRILYLFMAGAPSQLEMLDHKPKLAEFDGTLPPASLLEGYRAAFIDPNSKLMGPKFAFARHGRSGAEISELLPHLAKVADDIAIVKSMTTDAFNHAPAQILMNTGTQQFGKPSLGAWTLYGLGSESQNLPGYVVLSTGTKGPSGGNSNFGSGFLPSVYQGVQFRSSGDPVLYLSHPEGIDNELQRDTLDAIASLNRRHLGRWGDPEIATRINAYEMAFRMQASAPELMDLRGESARTLDLYGAKPGTPSFANSCLLARRMIERGVRFVQIFHEAWDQHGNLVKDLKKNCLDTDQACAALVTDLKERGLLEDTLVIWGGEFGRTPMVQGNTADGRDHHPDAFSIWMAGGGIKPGITHGNSDELGFKAVEDKVHVRDLHATILNQLGFDFRRFSYPFQGLDQRLTGVEPARVVRELLA